MLPIVASEVMQSNAALTSVPWVCITLDRLGKWEDFSAQVEEELARSVLTDYPSKKNVYKSA